MKHIQSFKIPSHQVEYFKKSATELGIDMISDSENDGWIDASILGDETSLVGLSFNAGMLIMQERLEEIVSNMKEAVSIDVLSRISSSNQNPTA